MRRLLALSLTLAATSAQAETLGAATHRRGLIAPNGDKVSLARIALGRPLVVVVIKGQWCRACLDQLSSLSRGFDEIEALGARVVALSADSPAANRELAERLELRFDVLQDPEGRLLRELDLWLKREGHPFPGLVFLDQCGDVAWRRPGRRPGQLDDGLIMRVLQKLIANPQPCTEVAARIKARPARS